MTEKTGRTKRKRLPQGWRKHIRRLKAEARRAGLPFREPTYRPTPMLAPSDSDNPKAKERIESEKV